jgi:signal transduction histidine kinase
MRQRLALLVSATMAMVLVAFVIPLAFMVRLIVADRAVADATDQVRSLSALVAAAPTAGSVRRAISGAARPVTVFLPRHSPIGAPATRTAAVRLAEHGDSFTVDEPGGREIVVAVQGLHGGTQTAVVRTFVSNAELTRGVTQAWLVLALLGLVLLGLGMVVADRLLGTVTRPIGDLARVSHRLAGGDLDARASLAGPGEVRDVARALNHLAGRIRDLIWQERESIADLSHRLRTPLTALRLEAEAVTGEAAPDGHLLRQVEALEQAVTSLIEDARTRTTTAGQCDAATVVSERVAFWAVLARDQDRPMETGIAAGPLPAGVAGPELGACLDALLGNVFAHTPQGTAFSVRLTARPGGGGTLTVADCGPGFAGRDAVRRGSSGGGSTGLGLDIARQAAESSGGSLTITPGNGGQVVVELGPPPAAAGPAPAPDTAAAGD